MSMPKSVRRNFLRAAGGGIAGVAMAAQAGRKTGQRSVAPSSPGTFDVKAFGATGDGKTLDTPAVNKAIEAAAAAGGGTVLFPAGSYLCYSIHLKSGVNLYLDRGSKIIAADSPTDGKSPGYDLAEPFKFDMYQDYGHSHWHNSLIWGEGLENIAILGPGLIWGKGLTRGPNAESPGVGNKSIALRNCRNVLFRDFAIFHGGHFGILATGVDNFTLDNLLIDTNRDAIDIDCCHNVRVSNCSINSPWDDGICLKSSFGLGYARACEDITITNCLCCGDFEEGTLLDASYKHFPPDARVPRTGRIKFGTESNGGFKNITISNCVCDGSAGIALESVDGALLEDVSITNITMRDISNTPIFLRLGRRMRGPQGVPVGALRRVLISNIVSWNSASRLGCIISGIPEHYIEDVKISNILLYHKGGGTKETAALQPPEAETTYPEPTMFGSIPAQGFFIRHVKNIEMRDIEIRPQAEDFRPAFILNDVQGAEFNHVKAPQTGGVPTFVLNNVTDFSVFRSKPVADASLEHAGQIQL